ncbi:RNA-guided endonuclease TnpB family protein [Nitrosococcus oceani]|uniref:RNA-guided endonuclease TnpB family protein n=1 Tax=Nitrosococcus oceani TaxID=1229 RepID=UPI0004E95750|nr:RNA-guided endonuclease TnpB family protein [Nitrosococcus oceani]KFI22820.1 hypothetical protein HW44_07355 [Nitrosococcus oceani]
MHDKVCVLINENHVIYSESLKLKNMLPNPRLATSISDAAWGEFVRPLEYKADRVGRSLVAIDQWYPSSKPCSACGCLKNKMPVHIRAWRCSECATHHDRDVNAAVNIKAVGLACLLQAGGVSLWRECRAAWGQFPCLILVELGIPFLVKGGGVVNVPSMTYSE